MLIRARHYANQKLVDIDVDEGRIVAVGEPSARPPDRQAEWIAPAFFDLQVNGCDGISFNSPRLTVDDVRHVVQTCRCHGVAGLLPTLVTKSPAVPECRRALSTGSSAPRPDMRRGSRSLRSSRCGHERRC